MGVCFGRGYQFGVALCENQRNKIKALLNFLLNGILKAAKQQRAEENRGKTNKQMEGRRLPFHLRPPTPPPPLTPFVTYWEVIEKCTKSVTKCQQVQKALTCAKRVLPKKKYPHAYK